MNQQQDINGGTPQNTNPKEADTNKLNEDFQVPDLDGDGMIGHTGGNFGDTTYTGGSLVEPQPGPVEEAPEETADDEEEH